jgi:hypothetical protein
MPSPRAVRPPTLTQLKNLYGFKAWSGRNRLPEALYIRRYVVRERAFPRWRLLRLREIDVGTGPRTIQAIWRREGSAEDELLRFDVFEFNSRLAAHTGLVKVLAAAESPSRIVQLDEGVGDVAFVGEGARFVVFARGNLLLVVRNAGATAVPVMEAAHAVDQDIIAERETPEGDEAEAPSAEPAGARVPAGPVPRFRALAPVLDEATRGTVPLHVDVEAPGEEVTVKLFSPSGELFSSEDRLMYRQTAKGEQFVRALAVGGSGALVRRSERFDQLTGRRRSAGKGARGTSPTARTKPPAEPKEPSGKRK